MVGGTEAASVGFSIDFALLVGFLGVLRPPLAAAFAKCTSCVSALFRSGHKHARTETKLKGTYNTWWRRRVSGHL